MTFIEEGLQSYLPLQFFFGCYLLASVPHKTMIIEPPMEICRIHSMEHVHVIYMKSFFKQTHIIYTINTLLSNKISDKFCNF